jgi:hypothetical protein
VKKFRFPLLGICQYIVLLGTAVVVGLLSSNFTQPQVIFCVDLREETAEMTGNGVENAPIVITTDL